MAFSFGSNQNTFGGNTAKPTGFASIFGQTPASTASTGFSFGTNQTPSFGATAQTPAFGATGQTPAFGATGQTNTFGNTGQTPSFGASIAPTFGATTQPSTFGGTAQAPAFGSTFGAAQNTTPAFGTSTFGIPATSAPTFGATSTPGFGGFGTTTTTASGNLFGGLGANKPLFGGTATTASSLFSTPASGTTSLFGQTNQPSNLFGKPAAAPTTNLFGNTAATSTPSLFGSTTSTAPSLFGTGNTGTGLFGASNTGGGLFGGTTTTQSGGLFGGFGTNANTSFGGLGTGASALGTGTSLFGGAFGAKPAEQAPSADQQLQQILSSFHAVTIFNDERDDILKKWNMVQACWGTGKGYFGPNQHVVYTNTNPLYRFKGVGYNMIIEADNADGLVKLIFNKKEADLKSQKDTIINGISAILGNKPNISVVIDTMQAMNDNQTELWIYVMEKGVTGSSRKIPAIDLANYLNSPQQKQQLVNAGVIFIKACVTPTKSEMDDYLRNPPPGVDIQMWEAAKQDNPDPSKFMPVVINGFTDLKKRMQNQETQTGLHKAFLQKVDKDISDLRKKHASSVAQITDLKQKFLQLQHRILKILVKQECTRKIGYSIQPEEEMLKGRLETLNAHLTNPTQFKGQLHEILAHIRTVNNIGPHSESYKIDPQVQEDIKQFLQMEQTGISHLVAIINNDLQALKIITEGMNQMLKTRPTFNL